MKKQKLKNGSFIPDHEPEQFIPGIYNYCDRWCERCPMTSRCRVYDDTERKKAEHIRRGEDPNDWNIVMQDVKEDMEETIQLLQKIAEEEGIDLNALPDEPYEKVDPRDHPLNLQAKDGIVKSIAALQKIYKWNESLQDEALQLMVKADRIRKGIDAEFPGHHSFKRPGFDE